MDPMTILLMLVAIREVHLLIQQLASGVPLTQEQKDALDARGEQLHEAIQAFEPKPPA